jgi:peroxiredoxin Q/BCP
MLAALVLATALPAAAGLKVGDPAPVFTTQASLGGNVVTYDLAAELKKGPVVLYFFPAAFTPGCTVEAHDFADHVKDYAALGASVIGVSGDSIEKLKEFSVSECRSKFPVAADPALKISKSYDATILNVYANRTSYLIAQDGKIAYTYTALDPSQHVANTLAAVKKLAKP